MTDKMNKRKFILAYVAVLACIIIGIALILVAEIAPVETVTEILLIVIGILTIIVSAGAACVLELNSGSFECPDCGEKFTPSMKEYILAPHTITRRYLRCPGCGEKKMCKYSLHE